MIFSYTLWFDYIDLEKIVKSILNLPNKPAMQVAGAAALLGWTMYRYFKYDF